ncbi:hypothetical protein ACQ4PT_015953 [Festuca glaucescens]
MTRSGPLRPPPQLPGKGSPFPACPSPALAASTHPVSCDGFRCHAKERRGDAAAEGSLSYEAKEVFLAALVSEGRAEWIDKSHKKCLILWLRIQDWANYILDFVKESGLEVTTIEDIRSGIETHGTELAGIDRGVLIRALKLLEQKGKATIFKGTSADDEGVKFSV